MKHKGSYSLPCAVLAVVIIHLTFTGQMGVWISELIPHEAGVIVTVGVFLIAVALAIVSLYDVRFLLKERDTQIRG